MLHWNTLHFDMQHHLVGTVCHQCFCGQSNHLLMFSFTSNLITAWFGRYQHLHHFLQVQNYSSHWYSFTYFNVDTILIILGSAVLMCYWWILLPVPLDQSLCLFKVHQIHKCLLLCYRIHCVTHHDWKVFHRTFNCNFFKTVIFCCNLIVASINIPIVYYSVPCVQVLWFLLNWLFLQLANFKPALLR